MIFDVFWGIWLFGCLAIIGFLISLPDSVKSEYGLCRSLVTVIIWPLFIGAMFNESQLIRDRHFHILNARILELEKLIKRGNKEDG